LSDAGRVKRNGYRVGGYLERDCGTGWGRGVGEEEERYLEDREGPPYGLAVHDKRINAFKALTHRHHIPSFALPARQ